MSVHGLPEVANERRTRRMWRSSLAELVIAAAKAGFAPTRLNVVLWLSLIVSLGALLAMTAVLADGRVYGWEVDVTRWAQDVDYPQWLFRLTADRLTNSDTIEGALIIGSIAVGLWLLHYRLESVLVLVTVPLHVIANFPKLLVERERPSEIIDGLTGFGGFKSFPSGHAEFAITFYGFLLYVGLVYIGNRAVRLVIFVVWLALVLAVGFARIEVGKHWPLDIIAGYVIGIGMLSGLIWLHRSFKAAEHDARATDRRDRKQPSLSPGAHRALDR
jgi:membrane-associated phospholipid phosphatase